MYAGAQTADYQPEALLRLDAMEAAIGGIDWAVVTNAGIINGQLHLQFRRTENYHRHVNEGQLHVIDGNGERLGRLFEISRGSYNEMVFDISGIGDLADIRLASDGEQIDNTLLGPWSISFVVEQELPRLIIMTADPDGSPNYNAVPQGSPYFVRLEIKCTPISTIIVMHSIHSDIVELEDGTLMQVRPEEFENKSDSEILEIMGAFNNEVLAWFLEFDMPYLNLNVVSVIVLEWGGQGVFFDYYGGHASYVSEYFDIGSLYSITFCGEEYLFSPAP